jgi:hypothetical protein
MTRHGACISQAVLGICNRLATLKRVSDILRPGLVPFNSTIKLYNNIRYIPPMQNVEHEEVFLNRGIPHSGRISDFSGNQVEV